MAKRRWADLSAGQKIAVAVAATLQAGLLVAALWDLAHRGSDEVRGDRRVWAGLVFINWIGPLAYFTVGRKRGLCDALMRWCTATPCCSSMPCCDPRSAGAEPAQAESTQADTEASSV